MDAAREILSKSFMSDGSSIFRCAKAAGSTIVAAERVSMDEEVVAAVILNF